MNKVPYYILLRLIGSAFYILGYHRATFLFETLDVEKKNIEEILFTVIHRIFCSKIGTYELILNVSYLFMFLLSQTFFVQAWWNRYTVFLCTGIALYLYCSSLINLTYKLKKGDNLTCCKQLCLCFRLILHQT